MSGQYVRLRDSKRNELIANFQEGIMDPEYEVIPNKTTKGKYTIRKRKVPLPTEPPKEDTPQEETPAEEQPQQPEGTEEQEDYNPYFDDQNYMPSFKMNKNAMFREMQMMMNRMFIENMKMMRQQVKQTEKKRMKLKEKNAKISNMLTSIVEQAEREEAEENVEGEVEVPEETTPEQEPEPEPEPVPQKEYTNEYEKGLDMMAGDVYSTVPSRRNRLHTEKFGI